MNLLAIFFTFFLYGIVYASDAVSFEESQQIRSIEVLSYSDFEKLKTFNTAVMKNHFHACKFLLEQVINDYDATRNRFLRLHSNSHNLLTLTSSPYFFAATNNTHSDIRPHARLFRQYGLDIENNSLKFKLYPLYLLLSRSLREGYFDEMLDIMECHHMLEEMKHFAINPLVFNDIFLSALIARGISFADYRDSNGSNILFRAVSERAFALAERFLDQVDLTEKNHLGQTILELDVPDGPSNEWFHLKEKISLILNK